MTPLAKFFDYLVGHADRLAKLLIGACFLLVVLSFFIDKHPHFTFQNIPAFYGLIAIAAYTLLLLLARLCRTALRRPEDYYDEQ